MAIAGLAGVDAVRETSAAFLPRTVVQVAVSLVTSALANRVPTLELAVLLVARFEFLAFYAEVGLLGRKDKLIIKTSFWLSKSSSRIISGLKISIRTRGWLKGNGK